MVTDSQGRRTCDCCERVIAKAHRIYKGTEYCQSCYEKHFVPGRCPTCGSGTRYHRAEREQPECEECLRDKRQCGRCHRPTPRAALIVQVQVPVGTDGRLSPAQSIAVCPSCVPYFREPEPCGICEVLSTRLSRAAHLPADVRACPVCVRKQRHATCSRCRKHRKIESEDGGRPLCKACSGASPVSHSCPECGAAVPGAGGHTCDSCSIATRLTREVELRLPHFQQQWVADLFTGFAQWSRMRRPRDPRLPANVVRSLDFFLQLDRDMTAQPPLQADDLLRVFDSKALRANLNASTFLQQQYGFLVSAEARVAERKRSLTASKLVDAQGEPWELYLQGYAQSLSGRAPRTVAQYVTTAEAFCRRFQISGSFGQAELVAFLSDKPGARTNIGPWVSYVQKELGWPVTLPPKAPGPVALKQDSRRLDRLLKQLERQGEPDRTLLTQAVALAFGFSEPELAREVIGLSESGDLVTTNGPVEVPPALRLVVSHWARACGLLD